MGKNSGQNGGAVLVLSNPGEDPPIDSEMIHLQAGAITFVSVKQEVIKRQPEPFSTCSESWPHDMVLTERMKRKKYTFVNCRNLCREIQIVNRCNCSTFLFSDISEDSVYKARSHKKCDFWSGDKACVAAVSDEFYSRPDVCGCSQPCEERILRKSGMSFFDLVISL